MQTTDNMWELIKDKTTKAVGDAYVLEVATTIHKAVQRAREDKKNTGHLFDALLAIESRMSGFIHPMNSDKVKGTDLLEHITNLTINYLQAVDTAVTEVAASVAGMNDDQEQKSTPRDIIDITEARRKKEEKSKHEEILDVVSSIFPSLAESPTKGEPNIPDFISSDRQLVDVKTIPIVSVELLPGEDLISAIMRAVEEHHKNE